MSKMTFFRAKINFVAHCKLSIVAPFTINLSKPWPLSLGHLQWCGGEPIWLPWGLEVGQKWAKNGGFDRFFQLWQLSRQGIVNSYKSIFQGMVRLVRTYKSNIVRLVSFDNSNPIFWVKKVSWKVCHLPFLKCHLDLLYFHSATRFWVKEWIGSKKWFTTQL